MVGEAAILLTLLFAYLGWRSSAIENETERTTNLHERFGNNADIYSFFTCELTRARIIERRGWLTRSAKYLPFFPFQGRCVVYLQFRSLTDNSLPLISDRDQIKDHWRFDDELYEIISVIVNDYENYKTIDIQLLIKSGDPNYIHNAIVNLCRLLADIGPQPEPLSESYYSRSGGPEEENIINNERVDDEILRE